MIHKTHHILLRRNKKVGTIFAPFPTHQYANFDVINDKGEVIDCYDLIDIKSEVRCDIELYENEWCPRYFSVKECKCIWYDDDTHAIIEVME